MENNKKMDQAAGAPFENLSTEDMVQAQGAGDVKVEDTTANIAGISTMPPGISVVPWLLK